MSIPKRHFYHKQHYDLDFINKKMILKPDFHQKLLTKSLWNKFGFKKVTGSLVGDVLEVDDFKSQFGAFVKIAWCGIPVLDRKYVDAGIAIEPMVINALEEVTKKSIQTFNPAEYEFDYFKDKDEIIGGIPDGFINQDQIILEIKTTGEKNYQNWNLYGIPAGYLKQAQIYTYLMGVKEYWIVATFLKEQDYLDPQNYPIRQRILKNYRFQINLAQVQDDIDKIKQWYLEFTQSGISPQWNDHKDQDLIEWLKCENEQQYLELLEKWKQEGKFVESE